jgi:Fe2+ or Zn2+ uptake regulation protein
MTKAQKAIYNAVTQSGRHLCADDVYWIVKQQFPSIALGTIYRNLNQLADSGMIRRVTRAYSADYFEGNTLSHDHALCVSCGRMEDLTILHLSEFLKKQMDCDIVSFDLLVNYVCPSCWEKEKTPPGEEDDNAAQYKEKKNKTD